MTGLGFQESDLYSFGGLVVLVPILVGGLFRLFGPFTKRVSHVLIVGFMFLIGLTVKATVAIAFTGFGWVGVLVGLLIASIAAAQAFDSAASIITGQSGDGGSSDGGKPPSTGGGTGG